MGYLHSSAPQASSFLSAVERQNRAKKRGRGRGNREWAGNRQIEESRGGDTDRTKESVMENKLWLTAGGTHRPDDGGREHRLCSLSVFFCSPQLYRDKLIWFEPILQSATVQAHVLLMCYSVKHVSSDQFLGLCVSHLNVVLGYISEEADSEQVILQITDSIEVLLDLNWVFVPFRALVTVSESPEADKPADWTITIHIIQ